MLMRSYPILSRFLLWIVFPILVACAAVYGYLLQSLPQTEGTIQVQGLDASVQVVRDENAIPHIIAQTDHDAFFTIGYLHAQERLWQMNYKRRLAQGRLSEVMGLDAFPMDRHMRGHDMVRAARAGLKSLDDASIQALEAYSAGINAWIEEDNILPVEFYLLDAKPEPWKPEDSILLMKLMSLTLGPNHLGEFNFDLLVKELGYAKANEMMPNVNPVTGDMARFEDHGESLTAGTGSLVDIDMQKDFVALQKELQQRFNVFGETAVGSNAWAVSGEHTDSGLPLLAGDPHLFLEIPSIWYMAEIQGQRLHVTGATFPGVPIVLMGRNNDVAWGVTNMMPDVLDLYMERTNPINPNQYEADGEWVDMEIEEQVFHIKSAFPSFLTDPIPPIKWQIRRTRNGPLVTDVLGRVETPLALKWNMLDDEDKSFQSYLNMNYAQDMESFKSALEYYKAPVVNIIYADQQNNIAHFVAGKLPMRKNSNGRLPQPGWDSRYGWGDYIPFDQLPHKINPEEGYVISANNKNHPDDYPHILSNYWSPPYRMERIKEVFDARINAGQKIEPQDFALLQGDSVSLQVREVMPFLLSLTAKTADQEKALTQLKEWDGVITGESEATALYQVWLRHFNNMLVADDLNGNMLHERRGNELQEVVIELRPEFITQVLTDHEHIKFDWCDQINTEEHESCEDLALIALDTAIEDLDRVVGFGKKWGDIYETYLPHLTFTNTRFMSSVFDRSIEGNSDRFSVNRSDWAYTEEDGYRAFSTAGYRQVVDLSDENRSGFINSTGQSGNLLSQHYDDNISPFKELKLWPMHSGSERNPGEGAVLNLEPNK